MKNSIRFFIMSLCFIMMCLNIGRSTTANNPNLENQAPQNCIFVILSFSDFSCPPCLSAFADAVATLRSFNKTTNLLGLVTVPDSMKNVRVLRILGQQIRGFQIGYHLDTPILVDNFDILKNGMMTTPYIIYVDFIQKKFDLYKISEIDRLLHIIAN